MRWGLYKSEWGFDIRDKVGRRELGRRSGAVSYVVYVQAEGAYVTLAAADMTPSTSQAQKRKGPPEFRHLPAERGKLNAYRMLPMLIESQRRS